MDSRNLVSKTIFMQHLEIARFCTRAYSDRNRWEEKEAPRLALQQDIQNRGLERGASSTLMMVMVTIITPRSGASTVQFAGQKSDAGVTERPTGSLATYRLGF